jgi:hypothetical protein
MGPSSPANENGCDRGSPVDPPDPFGFVFDDSNVAILHLIAEGEGAADPKSLSL